MRNYRLILIFFCCLYLGHTYSQNTCNYWFFGSNAGVNFSNTPPTGITGSTSGLEGSGVACDQNGDLLFYTDGVNIWDKNHNVMPNGSGLIGGSSAAQSGLIVQIPQSCNRYLVFYTDDHLGSGNLAYSEVDMTLNGGLGDVVSGVKNITVYTSASEQLLATKHANGIDYWIVSHQRNSSQYSSYLLTSSGLSSSPIYSNGLYTIPNNNTVGMMGINHAGTQIVTTNSFGTTFCELLQFDKNTGQLAFPIDLVTPYGLPFVGLYGIQFSPNDALLYLTSFWSGTSEIHQLDLSVGTKTIVGSAVGNYAICALQMGPNGKIYVARGIQPFIDVINNPNISGSGCGYQSQAITLASGTSCGYGLPSLCSATSSSVSGDFLPADTVLCSSNPLSIEANTMGGVITWFNGSSDSVMIVNGAGTYWAELNMNGCTVYDTIHIVNLIDTLQINDVAICNNSLLNIVPNQFGDAYSWSNGSTDSLLVVSTAGNYWVEIQIDGCSMKDSFVVTIPKIKIDIGNDTVLCPGQGIMLFQNNPQYSNLWSTGSSSSNIWVNSPGIYYLDASLQGCTERDSIVISYFSLTNLSLGPDKHICSDTSVALLEANIQGQSYLWSSGETTPSIIGHADSTYMLQVIDQNNCILRDTISIISHNTIIDLGKDISACMGEAFLLNAKQENFTQYLWSTGSNNASIYANKAGEYAVSTLDVYGCISSDTIIISLENCNLYIPNAFTPDDDDLNPHFKAIAENLTEFKLEIFNRWGELIFESSDILYGWDGTYQGQASPVGIYTYKLTYRNAIEKDLIVKYGQVTLIR